MRFVSVRDLRNTPAKVWATLGSGDLVLTNNGEPFAIITKVEAGDLEGTLAALRRARAQQAVSELRAAAATNGTANMSDAEIEAEIRKARRARASR